VGLRWYFYSFMCCSFLVALNFHALPAACSPAAATTSTCCAAYTSSRAAIAAATSAAAGTQAPLPAASAQHAMSVQSGTTGRDDHGMMLAADAWRHTRLQAQHCRQATKPSQSGISKSFWQPPGLWLERLHGRTESRVTSNEHLLGGGGLGSGGAVGATVAAAVAATACTGCEIQLDRIACYGCSACWSSCCYPTGRNACSGLMLLGI
jgi:hypothetical protein